MDMSMDKVNITEQIRVKKLEVEIKQLKELISFAIGANPGALARGSIWYEKANKAIRGES